MRIPEPFVFFGCTELRESLGLRARDEQELMELLERVPVGSVYYHTHSIFLRRHQVAATYSNDFANWVASHVRDQTLAERLAIVDPFAFDTLEALREELVSIIDHHTSRLHPVPRVVFGEPFYFVQSHLIEVPIGLKARTLVEFRHCLAHVDASSIYLHALEARVRRGHPRGNFADWLERALGLSSLAEEVAHLNPYLGGLEDIRARMLQLLDAALAREGPASGV